VLRRHCLRDGNAARAQGAHADLQPGLLPHDPRQGRLQHRNAVHDWNHAKQEDDARLIQAEKAHQFDIHQRT
jgi:hypothetical protein